MPDTIDRIQVEFTANIQEFLTQLSGIESGIAKVTESCSTVESATSAYTSSMEKSGAATAAAVTRINEYTVASTAQADAARTAAAEARAQGEKTSEAFDLISSSFTFLRQMLATFGVSVGVGALISQVRELAKQAEEAGKAYGKMYNTIYYTTGSLTASQQELAKSLRLEGFDATDIAETISRLTNLFPDAETTMLDTGQTVLSQISEELLWMDRKGYGDVSDLIDQMNTAFKKWQVPSTEITGDLGYLAAAYRDTNTDVGTLMTSLTTLDEVGRTLGYTFRDMVDFISAANVAGNLEDLSNVGMRFESQYTSSVSDIYAALLNADYATLEARGMSAESAARAVQTIVDTMAVDETAAKVKAQELAASIVTAIFQAANEEAANAATQAQASQIWADALDSEVSRVTNRLADLSQSISRGYTDVRTENRDLVRETGLTTTVLVTQEKGLGTSDYKAQNTAKWEEELSRTWFAQQAPLIEKRVNEYQKAGYEAMLSGYLGRTGTYIDVLEEVNEGASLLNPMVAAMQQTGLALYDWLLTTLFPTATDDATAIGVWVETCAEQLSTIGDRIAGTDTTPEVTVVQEQPAGDTAADTWLATVSAQLSSIGDWFAGLAPVGTASAAEIVAYVPDYPATQPTVDVYPAIEVTPEITVYPQVAVTPEVAVNPAVSINPEVSVTPEISVNPDVSIYPEVAVTPEITVSPEVSVTPEISINPEISLHPEVAVNPELTINPAIAVTPEISVNPSVSVSPEISIYPEITVHTESAAPHLTVSPEVSVAVTPDIAVYPTIETPVSNAEPTADPSATSIPDLTFSPTITVEPQITLPSADSSETVPVTEQTTIVNPASVPELTIAPQIAVAAPDVTAQTSVSIPDITVSADTPHVSVNPEITVTPAIQNVNAITLAPEITVVTEPADTPAVTVDPVITVTPPTVTIPDTGTGEPISVLANISAIFERLTGRLEVPLTTGATADADMHCPVLPAGQEDEGENAYTVSAVASLRASLEEGTAALAEVLAYLNRILAELSAYHAPSQEISVVQYISAPVADTYAVKNAAAQGVSVAQAGLWRQ